MIVHQLNNVYFFSILLILNLEKINIDWLSSTFFFTGEDLESCRNTEVLMTDSIFL